MLSILSSGASFHSPSIMESDEAKRIGRGIRRIVTLCGTITQLVAENDSRLLGSESDADSDGDDEDGNGDDGGRRAEKKEEKKR